MAIEDYQRANAPIEVPAETQKLDEFVRTANNNNPRPITFDKRHTPEVDIYEDGQFYEIDVMLPGMEPEDVDVNVEGNEVRISGEKLIFNPRSRREYHTVENNYGRFDRSFRLPGDADKASVSASYDAGILKVSIPRTQSSDPPDERHIEIE